MHLEKCKSFGVDLFGKGEWPSCSTSSPNMGLQGKSDILTFYVPRKKNKCKAASRVGVVCFGLWLVLL